MKEAQEQVKEFHRKHGFPVAIEDKPDSRATSLVLSIAYALLAEAKKIEYEAIDYQKIGDARLYRTHLLVEELGEALEALGKGDEVKFFDGLCDLLYVTLGCGVTMNLPLAEGFQEVHSSNMSKPSRTEGDPRMRERGGDYHKPDLASILARHRIRVCTVCKRMLKIDDVVRIFDDGSMIHIGCEGVYNANKEKEDGTR